LDPLSSETCWFAEGRPAQPMLLLEIFKIFQGSWRHGKVMYLMIRDINLWVILFKDPLGLLEPSTVAIHKFGSTIRLIFSLTNSNWILRMDNMALSVSKSFLALSHLPRSFSNWAADFRSSSWYLKISLHNILRINLIPIKHLRANNGKNN
jgi:hypothetical protein